MPLNQVWIHTQALVFSSFFFLFFYDFNLNREPLNLSWSASWGKWRAVCKGTNGTEHLVWAHLRELHSIGAIVFKMHLEQHAFYISVWVRKIRAEYIIPPEQTVYSRVGLNGIMITAARPLCPAGSLSMFVILCSVSACLLCEYTSSLRASKWLRSSLYKAHYPLVKETSLNETQIWHSLASRL